MPRFNFSSYISKNSITSFEPQDLDPQAEWEASHSETVKAHPKETVVEEEDVFPEPPVLIHEENDYQNTGHKMKEYIDSPMVNHTQQELPEDSAFHSFSTFGSPVLSDNESHINDGFQSPKTSTPYGSRAQSPVSVTCQMNNPSYQASRNTTKQTKRGE